MDTMQYTHLYRSPLGTITLAADSEGLTGLWFEGQKYFAATLDAQHEETMLPIFEQTAGWTTISEGTIRDRRRPCTCKVHRSGWPCGKFCGKSPSGRRSPTERSPVKSPAGKARKPSRHKP